MHFAEALRYLLSLGHETLTIKPGLKNTELLLDALGNPQSCYPSVQIAGTNGKGSTAAFLDSICRLAGIATGLYTSPHLISIKERIKLNGREISQPGFARYSTEVREVAQRLLAAGRIEALPTFFEQVTAIAFLTFRAARVDLAILETGLGGRLDSATAARADTVALTPIAIDHQEYLGATLREIAAEKAAIIRPLVCAIIAEQPEEVLDVIRRRCEVCNVIPSVSKYKAMVLGASAHGHLRVNIETEHDRYHDVLVGLRGRHQITNAAVAIRLAESLRARGFAITHEAIVKGIETARHAGRVEIHEGHPTMLFDGAHNPSGARALRDYLDEFVHQPITLVFGAMRDKNLEEMAGILFPVAERLILTRPENPRAATAERLAHVASGQIPPDQITVAASVKDAIRLAKEQTPEDGTICFAGSLYLIGEVQALTRQARSVGVAN